MTLWVETLGGQVRYVGRRFKTRVLEIGEGDDVLLLLHGGGGHLENFSRNVRPYGRRMHVLALDFLWHGYSEKPDFDDRIIPVLVEQVLDVMDAEGIASAHIEGQSMGGWVAMRLALEHPERVRRLVLTTTMGLRLPGGDQDDDTKLDPDERRRLGLAVLEDPSVENIRMRLERLVGDRNLIDDEIVAVRHAIYNDPETNAAQRQFISAYVGSPETLRPFALTEDLVGGIDTETLVYWGLRNNLPPPVGEHLARALPAASYYCADVGHLAQFERHDEHNEVVLEFLLGNRSVG